MPDTSPRHSPSLSATALVWLLGLTQIVGYGTLYYSFGILAPAIAGELGWSVSALFGAFSAALLLGGLCAPWAGRLVDRHGAPRVMTAGSLLACLALLVMARGSGPAGMLAGLALMQMASTLALYDCAFACLVQRTGPRAGLRITHLTLIAGFASTLFWPLTSTLLPLLGWRGVLLLYALLNAGICAPLHALAAAAATADADTPANGQTGTPAPSEPPQAPLPPGLQRQALVWVATGFALGGFVLSAVLAQMVPLLAALGLGSSAVLISTLFGPSQVLIRFASLSSRRSDGAMAGALVSAGLLPLSLTFLGLPGPAVVGAGLFAVALGCGSGLKSIVQGTLPLLLFGRTAYAERLGRIAAVRLVVTAAAPFVLAWLLEHAGPGLALAVLAASGVAGLACLLRVDRLWRFRHETV